LRLIMKFGGTSVADADRVTRVARIVAERAEGDSVVVVVSALGSVTDRLLEALERARNGDEAFIHDFTRKLAEEHLAVARGAVRGEAAKEVKQTVEGLVGELERALIGVIYLGEVTARSRDYVLSFGERLSAPILWGALRGLGLKAQCLTGGEAGIVTDSNFGEARPLLEETGRLVRERVGPLLEEGVTAVVTGFIAATGEGVTTTLGRGGSDYTATLLGAALRADEVWIWTDVDGLMTTDPRILPSARTIPRLSFAEATEMAVLGAKAMHPRALEPAMGEGIPVRIRNTFRPESPGTLIVREQAVEPGNVVKAVTLVSDVALVTVGGAGMVGTPGTAARVFDVLGRAGINILMISQSVSEANISLVIRRPRLEEAVTALKESPLTGDVIREVTAERDVCILAAVGAGMRGTPGVAARVFGAVARRGINVRMIAQGSSELNISLVVGEAEGPEAVRALHEEFGLSGPSLAAKRRR